MTRLQAERIASAMIVYVEAVAARNKQESPKLEAAARLAAERLEDALVEASRHG